MDSAPSSDPTIPPAVESADDIHVAIDEQSRDEIPTPHCYNMVEHASANALRSQLNALLAAGARREDMLNDPLSSHLLHGLAYTVGSALGSTPPSNDECLAAFLVPNIVGLTAGARAWSKHAHRSGNPTEADSGWWGSPRGSVTTINARARALFDKVVPVATWRNLHWLPHEVLVYEIRVPEGYGMRWSRNLDGLVDENGKIREGLLQGEVEGRQWMFRGFVEPMMENGHEVGWKH